jgi:uncharacterized protein (TIGR00251 family)
MGTIRVRVTPRASRNEIAGRDAAGTLRVRLTAPPVEGAANRALVRLVADALGIPPSRVRIARGETGRVKTVDVDGIDDDELRKRLGPPADAGGERTAGETT